MTFLACIVLSCIHNHKTPNDISGYVFILGEMGIWLDFFITPVSWSVAICYDSIFLPSGSHAVVLFEIMTGAIVVVDFFLGAYSHPSLWFLACFTRIIWWVPDTN